jgi:hypothetical protein
MLDEAKLLEELGSSLQDLGTEYVLLAIDPQVRKTFLSRVENLCQVAERALFV